MKLIEVYDEYIDYISLKNKMTTVKCTKYKFKNYILPYFKNYDIDKITVQDYINFQLKLKKLNYSKEFYNHIHSNMVSLFNFLNLKYGIANIPMQLGKMQFSSNSYCEEERKTWTNSEYKHFIKHVDNKIYHALFNLLFYTGLRKGEALALSIKDLNKGYITINKTITKEYYNGKRQLLTPKSKNSIRKIKIDLFLNFELKKLIKYYKKNYSNFNDDFFLFGGNKPIATTTLDRKKNEYCKKANITPIRIHDFRHSHATMLYNKKIKIKTIQKRLGHADISTTLNTYVHPNDKEEKKLIKKINFTRL